jgi:hypothetical protein
MKRKSLALLVAGRGAEARGKNSNGRIIEACR